MDTTGLFAQSVFDVEIIHNIIVGNKQESSEIQLKDLRIGVPMEYFYEDVDTNALPLVNRVT